MAWNGPLTKPQVRMLVRLMRRGRVELYGSGYRVAGNLAAQGRCVVKMGVARPTAQGLHALYANKARVWGAQGGQASLRDMEEVKQAIAAQFPSENLLSDSPAPVGAIRKGFGCVYPHR